MPRFKLILEFDGGPFVGWQRQDNGVSVQGRLEEAVFNFCGERVVAHAAGRTDSGVHALAMPAHIEIEKSVSADVVRDALNFYLRPAPIAILEASEVGGDFHARFSAKARSYRYRIINRRSPLTIDAGRAWRVSPPLDADAMNEAAKPLVGKHDFTTFRAAKCQATTPIKTLTDISVTRVGDEILVETSAPSFLHHQVRSITGSLVDVGTGRWPVSGVRDALAAKDRSACGQVAPPDGLYFVKADYD
jgi:tRNA pseudouridine38-40 synthase